MYPKAYIHYLAHFHGDRDFFECHEILEEYWKEVDKRNKRSVWVGLILIAVSAYHHRRQNLNGAKKTLKKGMEILQEHSSSLRELGIHAEQFFQVLENEMEHLQKNAIFLPYDIPLNDRKLEIECMELCKKINIEWKCSLDVPPEVINRHLTRDRSIVLKEREEAIRKRKK